MRPSIKPYLWIAGPIVLLAYAGGQFLPASIYREFCLLLPPWILGALFLLFGMYVAPLPLLALGHALGSKLQHRRRLPDALFLALCFIYFITLAGLLSGLLFSHVPHINDSINQYVHAKFVASGHVSIASHPLKEFFDSGWMVNDGRWYSAYSPAHILFLSLGHLAGLPWMINPLLGALTVIAVYFLARELYNPVTARLAALLACLSPFLVFMSSEYMNHSTALLFTTLFILFAMRTLRTRKWQDALMAGFMLGIVALTRPYTAFGVGLPYAALGVWHLYKNARGLLRPLLAFLFAILCAVAFQLWWNLNTTGNAFELAYHQLLGDEHLPGFGRNPWGSPHTLQSGIELALERIMNMNSVLFEWPVPSLIFVLMLVLSRTLTLADGMLLATYGSLVFVYIFFQGKSEVFGPRYHFEAIGALIILTAAAVTRLPYILKTRFQLKNPVPIAYGFAACVLIFLFAMSLDSQLPYRYRIYSHHYREGNIDYSQEIERSVYKPALVFVPDQLWVYLYVAFTLPPQDDMPVIFARDKKEHNRALIEYYPCRYAYVRDLNDKLWQIYMPPDHCPKGTP